MANYFLVTINYMNNIYGLVDPRRSDWVMYVGKGLEKRAKSHWQRFVRDGATQNARLRGWFQQLHIDGVVPDFIFLEENVANWQQAEIDWIAAWRQVNSQLCNIRDGGNEWPHEKTKLAWKTCPEIMRKASSKGGHRLKELHPGIARQAGLKGAAVTGGWRKFHELHPEAAKEAGRKGGRRLKELHPELARQCGLHPNSLAALARARTPERQREAGHRRGMNTQERYRGSEEQKAWGRKGAVLGAGIGYHRRWHLYRGILNLKDCRLCQEEYAFRSDFGC
jgi:general stress protein YciG